jgi:hypothetical protein
VKTWRCGLGLAIKWEKGNSLDDEVLLSAYMSAVFIFSLGRSIAEFSDYPCG